MHLAKDRKHVFINWDLIDPGYGVSWGGDAPTSWETPRGVRLATHHPRIDPEPLMVADRPYEANVNSYSTLFKDEGRLRFYYEVSHDRVGGPGSGLCYAESADGAKWVKPSLGTVEFEGSKDNNIAFSYSQAFGRGAHGATVFKDPNGPPDERYKMMGQCRGGEKPMVSGAVSPDGLRWTPLEKPLIPGYRSDTQTVVQFDEARGKYVGYFRGWTGDNQDHRYHGTRTIAYAETEDFYNWPWPQQIVGPDMHDNPDTDIYTNGYAAWPGSDAYLLFPTFYQRTPDTTEIYMMTSRDGVRWERPIREPIVPNWGPNTDGEGGIYAGQGLAEVRKGEVSLPVAPRWNTHNQRHFDEGRPAHPRHRGFHVLANWRTDGFTSLEAEGEGMFTTVPLTFDGGKLELNAWTRFGGEIRVEAADASEERISFDEVPRAQAPSGRAMADCDPITGDNLERTVTWKGESDLSALRGKLVRLRFYMRRARLYALKFA